ncbi:hypothetical protein, partial [Ectopseudomonas composti]
MMQCLPAPSRADLTVKPRLLRHLSLILLFLLLVLGCGYAGYHISDRAGIRALAENG